MTQLVLGTMNFGKRTPEKESARVIDCALAHGISTIDTANFYNQGESERIVGRALGARRKGVTLISKVGLARSGERSEGLSRKAIIAAIDQSLDRLGTDYLDIYYLHVPDHTTPVEESVAAMAELVRAGKIRAWAASNYAAWQVLEMITIADKMQAPRPVVTQQLYNVLLRELETEFLPFAKRFALPTTVYNPLAGGLLAGNVRKGQAPAAGSRFATNKMYPGRYLTPRMFERVSELERIAAEEGVELLTLAYAWLAQRPGVDGIVVGPAETAHLDAAVVACAHRLSAGALAAIDALHARELGTDTHYVR